ncbi:cytochrome ubiquinol oxidase subunit I [Rhizobium mongolense]|uniref:cytochrome ubiquinol oxidase subunit I n=1 Tax=Rhizobium mongolense TaxID=57676 RepID=UPI0034A1BD41
MSALLLSRLQFFWVIAWHILMPAFTVGLASFIAFTEGLHFFTRRDNYLRIAVFWTKIFAVAFGMGVVSGIVMPFQFGTNWSRFSDATANIISPLLADEGLTAFFLEAGFLGVLLFGRNRVPRWAHFFAAVMVAAGTLFSTFWILATNSWMQTPAGYELIGGRFFPRDWTQIIFNPSFPYRLAHTAIAFFVTTGFVVLGVSAWLLRREPEAEAPRTMMSTTLWLLLALVPLQIFVGDAHGLNTLIHQPTKLAAIEAHWHREPRAPLALFAIPDQEHERNRFAIEVPALGSLILTHDPNGVVPGLTEVPPDRRPPVAIPFFAFRIMVGCAMAMLVLVLLGTILRRGGRLYRNALFLKASMFAAPLGFVAVIAGWTTTEVGRQPWTVYGLLRTTDSVSPTLSSLQVASSLAGYTIAYLIMFPAGIMLILRIVRAGVDGRGTREPIAVALPQTGSRCHSRKRTLKGLNQ